MKTQKTRREPWKETLMPAAEDLVSATECTGLTPAAVQSQEEAQTYTELYGVQQQKPAWKHPDQKQ